MREDKRRISPQFLVKSPAFLEEKFLVKEGD